MWVGAAVSAVVATLVTIPLSILTCGLATVITAPVMFVLGLWPLITAIHGLVLTMNKDWSAPLGSFDLADRLFGSIQLEDRDL